MSDSFVDGAEYHEQFYEDMQADAYRSARQIVPLVVDLVAPESVVDVGCGTGAWLTVFRDQGVQEVSGVDGNWVELDQLVIPRERFRRADLEAPLQLERTFDLAICLEVAEHLSAGAGETLVGSLTETAPCVLFSAAVPGQGGVNHINEQPQSYWVEAFARRGYRAIDCLRAKIWANEDAAYFYRQNCLLYVRESELARRPKLAAAAESSALPTDLVHPELLGDVVQRWRDSERGRQELEHYCRDLLALRPGTVSLGQVLRALPRLFRHALVRRMRPRHIAQNRMLP